MNYAGKVGSAVHHYNEVGVQSGVVYASPHRLIQMLMDGALDKIALAKGYMVRKETALKGSHISWAISIVDGLRQSLDMKAGGDIARNLDDLYDYMMRRLMQGNLTNDPRMLDEVAALLREVKSAWDAIPPQVNEAAKRSLASTVNAVVP